MDKWLLFLLPVYLLLLAVLYLLRPPTIDGKWGYRTELSMRDEETFRYAQRLYGKKLLLAAIMMVPLVIIRFMLIGGWLYTLLFLAFEVVILCYAAVATAQALLRYMQN